MIFENEFGRASLSPLTRPAASPPTSRLLSQLYHSASWRRDARQPFPLCCLSTRSLSAAVSLRRHILQLRLSAARQFNMCSHELSPVCLFVDTSHIHGCARVYDTNVCLSFKGLRSHDRLHLISAAFEDNAVHMLRFFFFSLSISPDLGNDG